MVSGLVLMAVRSSSNFVKLGVEVRTTEACCCCVISSKVGFRRRKGFSIGSSNKDLCFSLHSSSSSSTRNNKKTEPGDRFDISCNRFRLGFGGNGNGNRNRNGNGNGKGNGNGGGGGGDNGEGKKDNESKEPKIPVIMKLEEVIQETEARGVSLPLDMLEAARTDGIPKLILLRYLDLQGSVWPLGFAMRSRPCAWLRNRMLADPGFLINLTTQLVVYLGGITIGQVRKYGKDFWENFEVYASHLFVGLLVKSALVSFTSPTVPIGQPKGFCGYLLRAYSDMPNKLFVDFFLPGSADRAGHSLCYMLVLYLLVGASCGLIGQGIVANGTRTTIRKMKKSNKDALLQPAIECAFLWGWETMFYGVWEQNLFSMACIPRTAVPKVGLVLHHGFQLANSIYLGERLASSDNERI